jgi:predicted phosphodiesterase
MSDEDILQELSRRGRKIKILEEATTDRHIKINTNRFHGDAIRIGAISCTHLGSLYQQLTALREYYRYCAETGVTDIFHAGDLVDGISVYEGQEYEIFAHGYDAQLQYAIENYPWEEGITTHVIAGNHDYSFAKISGANIVQAISREREDIHYLGDFGAHIEIEDIRIYIMHGRGGNAYARSYKIQKLVENFTPENKPHILLVGHWHTLCILPTYRNVEAFSLGSFQAQTPYLRRLGIWPVVCGLILEITPDDKGLAKIRAEWPMWHIMRENDY